MYIKQTPCYYHFQSTDGRHVDIISVQYQKLRYASRQDPCDIIATFTKYRPAWWNAKIEQTRKDWEVYQDLISLHN